MYVRVYDTLRLLGRCLAMSRNVGQLSKRIRTLYCIHHCIQYRQILILCTLCCSQAHLRNFPKDRAGCALSMRNAICSDNLHNVIVTDPRTVLSISPCATLRSLAILAVHRQPHRQSGTGYRRRHVQFGGEREREKCHKTSMSRFSQPTV